MAVESVRSEYQQKVIPGMLEVSFDIVGHPAISICNNPLYNLNTSTSIEEQCSQCLVGIETMKKHDQNILNFISNEQIRHSL